MQAGDLTFLVALAEARTFSAAARRLDTSHTTVARKLRLLERYFGTRLAERVGDGVVLTQAGEEALKSADRIAEELASLERRVAGRDSSLSGRISLTSVDILVWRYMPLLSQFRSRFPDIELAVSTETEVLSLSRRDAEVALRLTNSPEGYLFGHEIGRFNFAVFGHRELTSDGRPLDALPWLEYSSRDCRERSAEWKKRHVPKAVSSCYLPTPLMMLAAVRSGMGVGALPVEIAAQEPDLACLVPEPCFSLGVWLLAPEELRQTARVRALFDFLRSGDSEHVPSLDLTATGV
ncbi:LysR family transcriptional regulator [Roseibium sp. Sym1]|uniref:LysR family transcriptional regulator n=1 Tax=Roseibium sp. Sym1 TaxID=3016006 RepID=UPI0022B359AB|nr:LysR family transcriptional regulator [Roseibium sp. Sym1]